jgi:hypothetical protein
MGEVWNPATTLTDLSGAPSSHAAGHRSLRFQGLLFAPVIAGVEMTL